jgi:hypothetical protein
MPDNIEISPGAGATVATDQAPSGRHYQRMKLTDGAEGSENHASVRADGTQEVSVSDLAAAIYTILEALTRPISQEPGTGRLRVSIEAAATTLSTVTTVSTVTSMTQFNGASIWDVMAKPLDRNLWNGSVRMRIS